jgi:HD superfamily phosphohydrolase
VYVKNEKDELLMKNKMNKMNKILSKNFLRTLFVKQNHWHRHAVLMHTLKVTYHCIKGGDLRFTVAGLLHDIGKPFSAYQDEKDLTRDTYSFTNHEELSYQIIKNWFFVSDYTKRLVRYHYIIRDMSKCKEKGNFARYNRLHKIWDRFDIDFKRELGRFMKYDDLGKV